MKRFLLWVCFLTLVSSCGIFRSQKSGCPTNGKNIGAEKILANDPAAIKAARKAGKFVKQ